ncbi:IclR family transcriptional regulator [Geodermatophilus sp. DSM 44513]|uniref:IclR family transcriptional regulator n=1 Tax=Geodermatophilus sp. DSM 44513 TaxID=1528104 RepID=UPI00127B4B91|nr:IclR family transcriptional regulator [Geodermatophilus sp. DSM 44513]WNV75075.1 IclR family transcriptional regulator [Geodermatophilus sp. DSM 44513]
MDSDSGVVSSVERALRLLEALGEGPIGATELAHRIGTSKATAFRLARTLQSSGYVIQLPDARYRLGPRCLTLAASAFKDIDLRGELRWAQEELNERTGETTLLAVATGREAVCIDAIPSRHSVMSVATVGAIWPLHTSSPGLAMLAEDEDLLERYLSEPLSRHTESTITEPAALRALLADVRARGYAVNRAYWRDDVCAVGAVVHDATGQAVAGLAVVLPQFRLDQTGADALGALVLDVTHRASERLGWRGEPLPAPGVVAS